MRSSKRLRGAPIGALMVLGAAAGLHGLLLGLVKLDAAPWLDFAGSSEITGVLIALYLLVIALGVSAVARWQGAGDGRRGRRVGHPELREPTDD